jgi:hypothetical protein
MKRCLLPSPMTLAWAFGTIAIASTAQCKAGVESSSYEGQVLWLLATIAASLIAIMTAAVLKD